MGYYPGRVVIAPLDENTFTVNALRKRMSGEEVPDYDSINYKLLDNDLATLEECLNNYEDLGIENWNTESPNFGRLYSLLMGSGCLLYTSAPYGITTAERKHPLYMNTKSPHECQWNGPIWPFATTQTLNSLIKLLQMRKTETVTKYDFMNQLSLYAGSHYRTDESGKRLNWLDENLHPETGIWLSREILKGLGWPEGKGGYERGKDYNHSAFCDLVIRGICGVQPAEDNLLIMNPLLPEGLWDYFLLEELPYKGHKITIVYDRCV